MEFVLWPYTRRPLVTPSSGKTGKDKAAATAVERPAQAHSFHTEAAAEVQKMEKELLTLLSDFNTGKLRAFGEKFNL